MTDKPKCSTVNCERPVFSKGLCSGCYGRQWREARKVERAAVAPKQLTDKVVEAELVTSDVPDTHLVALNPMEMQTAQGNVRTWLERKLATLERDIVEANAALNEARRNGWATAALTSARNRAVDDEMFYNKVLAAVEAGHTIIPDFPIEVFAVRTQGDEKREEHTWTGYVTPNETFLNRPTKPDCSPAGAGEYRNPQPQVSGYYNSTRKDEKGKEYRPYTVYKSGYPVGPITFPSMTARSPIMKATAVAMTEKVFDQFGVCYSVTTVAGKRQIQVDASRAGDPLVIGQVVHKRVGSRQKVVSFIIAWYLNLDEL